MEKLRMDEYITRKELRKILYNTKYLQQNKDNRSFNTSHIVGAIQSICNNFDIPYNMDLYSKDIYVNRNYMSEIYKRSEELVEILNSKQYYTYEQACQVLGFKPTHKKLRNKCSKVYNIKGKMYFHRNMIDLSADINKNLIPINKAIDIIGIKHKKSILNLLDKYSIPYIDARELISTVNGYGIYEANVEILKEKYEREKNISKIEDRFEKYKMKLELLNIRPNSNTTETIDDLDDYIKIRFNENKKDSELVNAFININYYINNFMKKEIIEHTDKEIEEFITDIEHIKKLSVTTLKEFVDFYDYCLDKYAFNNRKKFEASVKSLVKTKLNINDAYKKEQFIKFWGLIFEKCPNNKEFINKITNPNARAISSTVLFCALHYVTVWRSKTMMEIPFPELESIGFSTGYDLLEWIRKGNIFTYSMGQIICNDVDSQIESYYMKASKNSMPLIFEVGRTMVQNLGMYLAIAEAHRRIYENKNNDVNYRTDILITESVKIRENHVLAFGNEYNQIFGNDKFSNRRANKSFIKFIIDYSDKNNLGWGMVIAALMRSHSLNGNLVSQQTLTYDNRNVDNSILDTQIELFNRGTFGFAKYKLLECIDSNFIKINKREQTKLLDDIELSPYQIETITQQLIDSKNNINIAIENIKDKPEIVKKVLNTISKGLAPAKHRHTQCLLCAIARDSIYTTKLNVYTVACKNQSASTCFGCAFMIPEIYFLKELNLSINESISKIEHTNNKFEIIMQTHLILDIYIPIINEAILEFGEDVVSSFIMIESIQSKLNMLNDKGKLIEPEGVF